MNTLEAMKKRSKKIGGKKGAKKSSAQVDAAKKKFVDWIKQKDPTLYKMAVARVNRHAKKKQSVGGLAGFLDIFNGVVSTIKDVAPAIVDMKNQSKILDAQIKAAQAGQPPLNVTYTPIVQNPNSAQAQNLVAAGTAYNPPASSYSTGFGGINPTLLFLPLAALGFFLLRGKKGRR